MPCYTIQAGLKLMILLALSVTTSSYIACNVHPYAEQLLGRAVLWSECPLTPDELTADLQYDRTESQGPLKGDPVTRAGPSSQGA